MKNKTGFSFAIISTFFLSCLANADTNLIKITTSQTDGYDTFNAFILQNSIKKISSNSTNFKLLLTGVSTTETTNNYDSNPISDNDLIDEYDLDDSRIMLFANMNCKAKTTKVEKILSIDTETGKLKEQPNSANEQDLEMNKAIFDIVCK
jgi:hypothetical protein